jgi:hypothetical protein
MKFISTEGYKRNSPDKNRPFNIIPSGNITMQDVDFPVKGVDNLGNEMIMMPGEEYTFPGDYVVETPAMQAGGQLDPVSTQGQEINFEQRKKQLEEKLKEEDLRVELVKGNVLTLALKALRDKEYKKQIFKTQLDEGSAYCSTRSCELERAAGYTVPKDVKVYGRNIPAGSKIPVIPGTSSFDRYAPNLGYKKIPIAELSPGDKMIDFFPEGAHSMIFSGDEISRNSFIYDDGSGKNWKEGYYPIYDKDPEHRYQGYRYVGNVPNIQNELNDAQRGVDMFTSKNNNWDRYNEESKEQLNKIARVKKFPNGGQTGWLDNYQEGGQRMYPAPSLEFQKRVQDNIRRNPAQPTFVRREPVTVSQTDNTRTNAVENAKRDLKSYTPQERAYFAQNNIPRDQWFSAKAKMQNDAVLKRREEIKRQAQADVRNNPFAITPATNEQLRNEFRAFPNDPNSFFDEYLNPAQMIGNLAASIGDNFTGEGPVDPWKLATDIVTPAFVGMTAGIGAQNTGQFANNLINPLAGTGQLVDRLGNRYLPNAYKLNPYAFKPNPEAYYHRSPNLQNIIDRENNVLQGFGKSDAGKAYSAEKNYFPGTSLNLSKPANNQLYFSKEVPLDYGRYNSPSKGMSGQGYKGPYLVEVTNVPMGSSVKGRKPTIEPPVGRERYATSHRPISLNEAKFYKEDWLRGYKQLDNPRMSGGIGSNVSYNTAPSNSLDIPASHMSREQKLQLMNEVDSFIRTEGKTMTEQLKSPEGRRRLYEQFKEADPNLSEIQLRELVNNRIESVDLTTQLNRARWLKARYDSLPNDFQKEAFLDFEDFNLSFPYNNAYYSTTNLFSPRQTNETTTNLLDLVKPQKTNSFLSNDPTPGHITLGPKFINSKPTLSHEVGHSIQKGGKMPLDNELRKMVSSFSTNPSLKSFVDDSYRVLNLKGGVKEFNNLYNQLNYFKKGSGGKEPTAFARELRQAMLDQGVIKDIYQEITPEILNKAKRKMPTLNDDNRLLHIVPSYDYKKLSSLMNKLPVAVPAAVGVGAALNTKEKGGETGWLDKYK